MNHSSVTYSRDDKALSEAIENHTEAAKYGGIMNACNELSGQYYSSVHLCHKCEVSHPTAALYRMFLVAPSRLQ